MSTSFKGKLIASGILLSALLLSNIGYCAQYSEGANDKEIRLGNTAPYSGPAASLSYVIKTVGAYFKKVNDEGGINGRKIIFISHDDSLSPAKTLEQTRRLVENDKVLLICGPLGTATSLAARSYLNEHKIPQLFVTSGADTWNDPKHSPWSLAFYFPYFHEGKAYADYIKANIADAKIAVLYQNDDFGKGHLSGLKEGLGKSASKMIVKTLSHEITDPSVDSQIINFQNAGANVFVIFSTPKVAAQAVARAYARGWKPIRFLASGSSPNIVLKRMPKEVTDGVITAFGLKNPQNDEFANDPGMNDYKAFMKKYAPSETVDDIANVYAYTLAQTMVEVLKQAGDNLTRANIMDKASHLDLSLPTVLPGSKLQTSPTDYIMFQQVQLSQYQDGKWKTISKTVEVK